MMYVLGSYADYGKMSKKLWIVTAISVFTHQSMFLFVPFLVIKPLKRKLTKKTLILIVWLMLVFITVGPRMASRISSNIDNTNESALTYGINRFSNIGDTDGLTMDIFQFVVVCIPIIYILLKRMWFGKKTLSDHTAFILNITLLLITVIIAMAKMPLAQYRYFNTIFAFLPFIYPFMFSNINKRDYFLKLVGYFMILVLMATISSTGRAYAPLINLICEPPCLLIAGVF